MADFLDISDLTILVNQLTKEDIEVVLRARKYKTLLFRHFSNYLTNINSFEINKEVREKAKEQARARMQMA